MAQIDALKKEISRLQIVLAARVSAAAITKPVNTVAYSCKAITADLFPGVENYYQVSCLQEFLKAQGPAIYPQGAVIGSFSNDTIAAVIRFQEKYASVILWPLGLKKGTGYVGLSTRLKINSLLAK